MLRPEVRMADPHTLTHSPTHTPVLTEERDTIKKRKNQCLNNVNKPPLIIDR